MASAPARHLDSAACDRPPELEDRLREFWAVEKKAAQHVEAVRRDRGMLQDVCLLGVEVGARELNGCLVVLQLSCEEICDFVADEASSGEAVLDHTRAAVDCVTRLLAVYKSVADIFCAVLEKKSSSSSHQDRRVQICRVFSTEVDGIVLWIGCQLQFLSDLHQPVRVWCQVEVAPADCDFYFSAAQAIYIALGDLSRYKEMHSPDQTPPDFRYALSYYQRALLVRAPTGAVHKKFATVAKASACPFEVIFHLFLCQSAHDSPFNSRDLLLDLLENQRACARALPETHALSQLTARQHYDRFVSHLLSCVSICYSRTGSDTFRQHLDSMRRHLSTLLQTHAATAPHRECDGHVGADDDILNNLQNDLTAGFTIILSVLYAVVKKNKAWELLSEELKFQSSSSSSSPALDTDPDVLQMLVTRRLNDLRSVPGFLDGIRLVCVFLVCVTGGTGLGLYSSLQDDADKYRELSRFRITLQSVSVFFDWIKSNEIYHIIPVLDFKLWKQLEASLQSYFDVLRRVLGGTSDKLTADSVLAEDFALRGFSPLCHTIRCRFDVCVSNHRWSTKQVFAPPVIDSSCQSNIFALAAAAATVSSPQEALRIRLLRCQHTMDYLSARTVNLPRSCWPNCSRNLLSLSGDARSHSDASGEEIDICFADDLKAVLAVRHVCCSDVNKKLLSLLDCSLNMQSLGCAATSATPGYKAPKRNSMLLPGFNVTARTDGEAAGEGSDAATEEELCGHTPAPDDTDTRDVGVEDEAKRSIVDTNRHNSTYPQSAGILHVDMSSVAVGVPTSNLSKQISNRDNRKSQKGQEISARKMQSDALYGRMFPGQQIGIVKGSGFDAVQLPTIVLDVPNIAMRHGLNSRFSCLGIRIVFDYFLHVGHKVVGFLPVMCFSARIMWLFREFIFHRTIILTWNA